jgi:predicted transcriptional regulator
MPITKLQFEGVSAETEAWMHKVHAFLQEHREFAYNEIELRDALPGISNPALSEALDLLLYLGGIDQRSVRGKQYSEFLNDI